MFLMSTLAHVPAPKASEQNFLKKSRFILKERMGWRSEKVWKKPYSVQYW